MAEVTPNYWIHLCMDSIFDKPGRIWQGEQDEDCPFDDLNVSDFLFSYCVTGRGLNTVPEKAKCLTSSGSCKLIFNGKRGDDDLLLLIATTKEMCPIAKDVYIQVDIRLPVFKDKQDCGLAEIFFPIGKKGVFDTIQQFKVKKLDSDRFKKFFAKDFPTTFNSSNDIFRHVHVVLKFTLEAPVPDARINQIWMKNQQIAGKKILSEGLLSDFTIEAANGKKFPCHKLYLIGRSDVFAGMMNSNMTEVSSQTLKMEDISSDAVEGLLIYLYTGSVKNVASNMSVIFGMLQTAHKYQIKDLEIVCNEVIQSADSKLFDAAIAFEIYEFCGNVTELQSLQQKSVKVLKDNGKKYDDSGELAALMKSFRLSDQKAMVFAKWMCNSVQR